MVKMLVPSLWGDLRTVASTMVKYGVAAKQVFGLITDLIQGRVSGMAEEEGKRKAAMKEFDKFDAEKRHSNGSGAKEIARDLKQVVKKLIDDKTKTSKDQKSRIQGELFLGKLEPLQPDLGKEKNMTLDSAVKKLESKKLKKEFLDPTNITEGETESQEDEEEEYEDDYREEHKDLSIKADKSEINDTNRVGHPGKSPGDDDGDDYYDYYNELVGKGADYNNEKDEKDEIPPSTTIPVVTSVKTTPTPEAESRMDAESGNSNVEDTNQMPEENKSEPEEDDDYEQMYNDLIGKGDDYYQI